MDTELVRLYCKKRILDGLLESDSEGFTEIIDLIAEIEESRSLSLVWKKRHFLVVYELYVIIYKPL